MCAHPECPDDSEIILDVDHILSLPTTFASNCSSRDLMDYDVIPMDFKHIPSLPTTSVWIWIK
jgi:hypothetical protein